MQKKFNFRLESLLKLRRFNEDKVKRELASIVSEVQEVKNNIDLLKADIAEAYVSYDAAVESGVDGESIKFFPRFIQTKKEDIKNKENLLHALERRAQSKREEMSKVRGEVKVVENLREKEHTKFKKEKEKKYQQELEEIIQMRAKHSSSFVGHNKKGREYEA